MLAALLLTLITHWAPSCHYTAAFGETPQHEILLADEDNNCFAAPIQGTAVEGRIVWIYTTSYVMAFTVPDDEIGGYIRYWMTDSYVLVNGRQVTLLIYLREPL